MNIYTLDLRLEYRNNHVPCTILEYHVHYMYNAPLNVIAVFSVCVVLVVGISQDTSSCPLRGTEEGA